MENLHEEDNTDLENYIIVDEQLVNSLPTYMQGDSMDFFSITQNQNSK
jgi:hypothetical protein